MYPPPIQHLIELFSQFPTVGPRTAARFAFYLQESPKEHIEELILAIQKLKTEITPCAFCFNPFHKEDDRTICPICTNPKRNRQLLCVVEKETDLAALEKTKKYNGLYFILGGTVHHLRKKDLESLRTKELVARTKNPKRYGIPSQGFQEIILATNATTEGEATALYLQRHLASLGIKTTSLGRGLPSGGELEYADDDTLEGALKNRT